MHPGARRGADRGRGRLRRRRGPRGGGRRLGSGRRGRGGRRRVRRRHRRDGAAGRGPGAGPRRPGREGPGHGRRGGGVDGRAGRLPRRRRREHLGVVRLGAAGPSPAGRGRGPGEGLLRPAAPREPRGRGAGHRADGPAPARGPLPPPARGPPAPGRGDGGPPLGPREAGAGPRLRRGAGPPRRRGQPLRHGLGGPGRPRGPDPPQPPARRAAGPGGRGAPGRPGTGPARRPRAGRGPPAPGSLPPWPTWSSPPTGARSRSSSTATAARWLAAPGGGPGRHPAPAAGRHRGHLGRLLHERGRPAGPVGRPHGRGRPAHRHARRRPRHLPHGLRRGLQRHAVVLPPPPLRPAPAAPLRPPLGRGLGRLPPPQRGSSPRPWPPRPTRGGPGARAGLPPVPCAGRCWPRARPDLRTVHFSHTPFADPSGLRSLPRQAAGELLAGMAGFGACGFHTARWEAAFRAAFADPELAEAAGGPPAPRTFVAPLGPDPGTLAARGLLAGGGRGRPPARRGGRRPAPGAAGRPGGALQEPAARVLGLRGAARDPARVARRGGDGGPRLPLAPGAGRLPRLPHRGRARRGPDQRPLRRRGLDARWCSTWPTTRSARWPPSPATTCCWSTRSATA